MAWQATEKSTLANIATIMCIRMFSLFSIFPILTLNAQSFADYSEAKTGLALGIFGMMQVLFLIPFGILADRFNKLHVLTFAFVIFIIGCLVAAFATDLTSIVIGRAIQGAGALSGLLISLLSDNISKPNKPIAMMVIGMAVGVAFVFAMAIAPIVTDAWGLSAIFWVNALLGLLVIGLIYKQLAPLALLQNKQKLALKAYWGILIKQLRQPNVMLINISVFLCHFLLMAMFNFIPVVMNQTYHFSHWQMSLALVATTIIGTLLIAPKLKKRDHSLATFGAILPLCFCGLSLILLSQFGFIQFAPFAMLLGLTLFMGYFSYSEAIGPTIISQYLPAEISASTMSSMVTFQYLGIFMGGLVGGLSLQLGTLSNLLVLLLAIVLLWFVAFQFLVRKWHSKQSALKNS